MREIEIHATKYGEVFFWHCDMELSSFLRCLTADDTQAMYRSYVAHPDLYKGENTLEEELVERTRPIIEALIERGMAVYRDGFWRGNFAKIRRELMGLPV